ncbi:MAG: septal ring lytic transglycosylase RlpA family protein [Alphaproteobacteria bacterium]
MTSSRRARSLRAAALLALPCVLLSACAETEFVVNTTKEVREATATTPKSQGVYKVGKPYQVDGVWYYPQEDYSYSATGIASWYGPDFHGKTTSNGEIFDMNEVTAAHKTLPLPSIARVTNLENGRSLLVRVNDRGPFVNGRIIDVSRRTAQLLGFEAAGTAKVRVDVVADQSRALAMAMPRDASEQPAAPAVKASPRSAVTAEALPPPPGAKAVAPSEGQTSTTVASAGSGSARSVGAGAGKPVTTAALDGAAIQASDPPAVTVQPVGPSNIYIQAGAFTQVDNANRLRARLSPLGQTTVTPIFLGNQQMFRVRLGPVSTVGDADQLLDRVIKAGYKDAQVIVAE